MDYYALLSSLKGKVLDVKNLELLEAAYRMQCETVAQLTDNNSAMKESNSLLREKVAGLQSANAQLSAECKQLKELVPAESIAEPRGSALAIMGLFQSLDTDEISDRQIRVQLKLGKIESNAAIHELASMKLIQHARLDGSNTWYELTKTGHRYVVDANPLKKIPVP